MQHLKALLLSSLLASLLSCVDAAPRDTTHRISHSQGVINSWLGSYAATMLKSKDWGAPTKTYTISGREYIVYVRNYNRWTSGRTGSTSYDYVGCTWSWEIRDELIVGGSATGPECNNK